MNAAHVFLIDTNRLFREGMKRLFDNSPYRVVGEAGSARDALAAIEAAPVHPDLVVVDPGAGGDEVEVLRTLRARLTQSRIVVLADALSTHRLAEALNAGVDGYLTKDIASESLMQSLKLVMIGEKVFPTHLAAMLIGGSELEVHVPVSRKGLSPREIQILRCLLNGNSNKMIANHLHITEATVKVHLKSLLRKINASNRTQAAIWAMNNGIGEQPAAAVADVTH
ncbi:LuxR C-terminal-related transcriptional regulator [Azospirillum halopraeferens]|uniref:LuxR C-terminal-related transcriptional regulator n=1 Tax=Azospirillum halopraeferens TaxID=34010 RepID=UPI00040C0322|nr:response regulator transcription factor [Azospirillum halopraeferens]